MFTGLVAGVGTVEAVDAAELGARLRVCTELGAELAPGDSVAVNGVCLTATAVRPGGFEADVMAETLRSSSLGLLAPGGSVNLELPVRADSRLGGHVVQGHVDGLGAVTRVAEEGLATLVTIAPEDPALLRYVVRKGSIAVDGVSLTVAGLDEDSFTVSLIPETLQRTSLGRVRPGTPVNLEVDVMAKYVEKLVAVHAR